MTARDAAPSPRTRLQRHPERGSHERARVRDILDQGLVAHVGLAGPEGPFVLPMAYARVADELVLHGSRGSRLMQELASGAPVCVTVTLVDGLVIARSAFRCSMNYRSVVVFGRARSVDGADEKRRLLDLFVRRLTLGVSPRAASDEELAATAVVALELTESSAKLRSGGPRDLPGDLESNTWAGEVPLRVVQLAPRAEPGVPQTAIPPLLSDGLAG